MRSSRVTATALAVLAAGLLSSSAMARHFTPLPSHHGIPAGTKATYHAPKSARSGTWTPLAHGFPGVNFPDTALVMTDGTVLMHDGCGANWYKLTPTNTGDYVNGTWSSIQKMPNSYQPLYFASQILPDGRLIVNGGEYQACNFSWTTQGALYDPTTNTWTDVPPPTGWNSIGDAQSVVRKDGSYMLADALTTKQAIATITGTTVTWATTGTGKADRNDEEGWTQLPDNSIITVDANRDLGGNANDVEFYSEATGQWTTSSEKTPVAVVDAGSHELGPAPLLPNGLMLQIGATPHNAVYDSSTGHWTAAPDTPPDETGDLQSVDGPAVVLPNGNVLEQVSVGVFPDPGGPSHFFEVKVRDASHVNFTQVDEPDSAPIQSSYEGRLVMLPTGQALWSSDVGDVQVYTPQGKPVKKSIPKIKHVKKTLNVGSSNNKLTGHGFHGLTYGGYYGDDAQMATNFPLVRITNNSSHHVCFARTHAFSQMGIDDGTVTSAQFDIPNSCETGASTLQVVVNGVSSKAKDVTLN
ncbi:MAG TPA: kelch repeat-containing protein [Rhizomicrobium sp.]|nr:kelch repeat-containing protein [Rhizomicrobium sp.]